jgi:outer membrane protein assembly factor BamB
MWLIASPVWAQGPLPGIRIRAVPARAAIGALAQVDDEGSVLDGIFLPPDRQLKRRLEVADEMIGEARYGEAVRLLGTLLEGPEDFFFKPAPDQPVFSSLKAEAGRLLAKLPAEGKASYDLQYGARAKQMLVEAVAKGDLSALAEVSRRFFFTQAGAEATFLLGRHFLDQNRPQAAAMCFERLAQVPEAAAKLEPALSLSLANCWLRAGKPDQAIATLVAFREKYPKGEVVLAGEPVKLFAGEGQALAWLEEQFGKSPPASLAEQDQWVMFRGDERRNASAAGGQPLLSLRWRQRTCDDSAIEEFVSKLRGDYLNQDVVALPSMHPLAVGDVVLFRTTFALEAVDFETGKLIWRYSEGEDTLEQFLRAMASRNSGGATQQLLAGLDARMWEDLTYGTLSSDSRNVYYVEDLSITGLNPNLVTTVLPNGQRRYNVNTRGTNRLAARELRTQGKLKWSVGGVTGDDEPKLAGSFFLGPPLPLMGQLYALAEFKGQEIRLVALSPETGALEWSQQLAIVDPPVTSDQIRRNSGATPSYADGVLVCPTASGALVGIDLSTRSLLWGYQYPRGGFANMNRFNVRASIYPAGGEPRNVDRWADGSVTIADGRLLVTPVETNELFCLNLTDGRELWKQPRGTNLYVGCIHEGKAIVVGHKAVSALNLADGAEAWPKLQLPDDAMPSGRGFYSGHEYFLPLTSAEVLRIDLNTGKAVDSARSRSGEIPGNLICYRDSIVSQNSGSVDAYYQLDPLKRQIEDTLAKTPADPRALASLGEIRLDEGALADAIELFHRSYEIDQDAGTRIQLVDSLLEGLRGDFAAYRGRLAELDDLIDQPRHRTELLRLSATGLQKIGELWPAFETYVKLLDEPSLWEIDEVDANLSVRRDRWLRTQFAALRAAADADTQKKMDALIRERAARAVAANSSGELRAFVNVFGEMSAAQGVIEQLVDSLGPEELLEQNLLIEREVLSDDPSVAGPAAARMATLLRHANRADLAAAYYRELNTRFADVSCAAGKTGKEIVAALPQDDPGRALLRVINWPTGAVKSEQKSSGVRIRPSHSQRLNSLDIVGARGPLLDGLRLLIAQDTQQHLVAEDEFGAELFRVVLNEQGARRYSPARTAYNAPSINYASGYGGLLVLSTGAQLTAIDTLQGDSSASRILWTIDLSDQIGGLGAMQSITPRGVTLKWGETRFVPEDSFGRRYGTIGPVTASGVFFQRLHELHCVDPISGKSIWVRKGVPLGLDLFGDEEYLLAAPPNKASDTLVLKAATGELVGTRPTLPIEDRMTTLGRRVLNWQSLGGRQRLEMRDLVANEANWTHEFASGSKASIIAQDVIGVFQPDGEFAIVRLADGKELTRTKLEKERLLSVVHLLPWDGGYLLITRAAPPANANRTIQAFPGGSDCPLFTGRIYAFGHDGKQLWEKPVSVSQYSLLLSQPPGLPALVLMRQMSRPSPIASREPRMSVMCIDKRTGKVVYQDDDLQGTTIASCSMTADPKANTVAIALPNQDITLTYTNDAQQAARQPSAEERKAGLAMVMDLLGFGSGGDEAADQEANNVGDPFSEAPTPK